MHTITVITVTLNNFAGFQKTRNSVRAQTYPKIEHVVIDGGSSDGTLELLELEKETIIYLSEPDQGIYDAMNKGVEMCSPDSKFVLFLNAGDTFHTDRVVAEVADHLKLKSAHFYGNVYKGSRFIKSVGKANFYTLATNMICHQAIFFNTFSLRKSLYDIQYNLCADYKLLLELLKKGELFEHINLPIAIFDETGVSSKQRELLKAEKKKIRNEFPTVKLWHFLKTQLSFLKR